MKPYDGIEVWIYFVLAALVITAVTLLVFAFRTEKSEKGENDKQMAKSLRTRKYIIFASFATVVLAGLGVGYVAESVSLENHRTQMVKAIESHNVKVVEGFVDPSIPLRAESHAKFVVETVSGIIRCRANSSDVNTDVKFLCQDSKDEDRGFTIPLDKVNDIKPTESKDGTEPLDNAQEESLAAEPDVAVTEESK